MNRSPQWRVALVGLAALGTCSAGDFNQKPEPGKQVSQYFQGSMAREIEQPYLLYLPSEYDADPVRRWPVILYLHGGSLRGSDLERLRTMGLPRRLENDRAFPFIVAAPLCPEGEIWTDTEALSGLLEKLLRTQRGDPARVYVVGHSMGGRGALYAAFKNPDRFAAVVAISSVSPISAWAKQLRNVPLWLIHGEKDTAVPVRDSDELAGAIEKAGGARMRYTRLPDRDHFILDIFDKNDVFDWLLEHSR